MNPVDNATLERIYFQGKRQRKYIGRISTVAQELADLVIAAAVSCENSQGVYWISFTEDDNVVDCEIRQSDCIMSISMISLGASPAYWPRNYYKLGKTITQYIVDAIAAKQAPVNAQKEAQSNQDATEESKAVDAYRVRFETEADYNYALVAPDGEVIDFDYSSAIKLEETAKILNQETEQYRKRIELLEAQVAKLQGDLDAAGNIIIQAGEQVEKKSRSLLDKIEENVSLKVAMRDVIGRMNESLVFNEGTSAIVLKRMREVLAKAIVESEESASTEAPTTKPIAARMHVNWSGRGFSSGSYEVLGFSNNKQAYVLNISTDPEKPMPKWVKAADCQA